MLVDCFMSNYLLYWRISAFFGQTNESDDNGWQTLLAEASGNTFPLQSPRTPADNRGFLTIKQKLHPASCPAVASACVGSQARTGSLERRTRHSSPLGWRPRNSTVYRPFFSKQSRSFLKKHLRRLSSKKRLIALSQRCFCEMLVLHLYLVEPN